MDPQSRYKGFKEAQLHRIIPSLVRIRMCPPAILNQIGEVDLKDIRSGPNGYICIGEASILRFLQGFTEEQISRSARWSYLYARHVLGSRFPKGERVMQSRRVNPLWWRYYNEWLERVWSCGKSSNNGLDHSITKKEKT